MQATMRSAWRGIGLAIGLSTATAVSVAAQQDRSPEAARGTELAILAGTASTAAETGPVVAGIAEWQLSRWLSAEARGAWLRRGTGAEAFTADLSGVFNLVAQRSVTPLVGFGFGLYHASFDGDAALRSNFYRRRANASTGLTTTRRTFTDPVFRVAAGVDLFVGRRLSVRPEVSALLVVADGHRETTGLIGVRLGYRFEDRPITPVR